MCIYVGGLFCFGESASVLIASSSSKLSALSQPKHHGQEDIGFDWEADWDGQDAMPVHYSADYDGEWYKLWKDDGSATGFYLAELVCPHSYYDKDEYCAMEFRCYYDDSASGFTYTLHDDC